jgi:hypothetical protein
MDFADVLGFVRTMHLDFFIDIVYRNTAIII